MSNNSDVKNKRIAKNTLFLYIRMFFVLIVALYTSRVTLNVLGVEDFGTYNVVCGFVSMFVFLNTAMSNAIQRFYSFEIGKNNGKFLNLVYTSAIITQILIALIMLLLAETVGLWYLQKHMVIPDGREEAAYYIYQCSIISFFTIILQVPFNSAIIALEKMSYYAIVSIIDVLIKLVCVIILQYINSDKLIFYASFNTAITIITFLLYYCYVKLLLRDFALINKLDLKYIKNILSFSGWNVCGSFAYMVQNQGLNLLLNSFFGTVINAARGISFQVMSAIQGFSGNIFMAIRPQVIQSYAAKDYKRTTSLMFSTSKITFYMFYLFSLPMCLEIDMILRIWLGSIVPDNTSIFTILVLINMLLSNFNTPLSQVVHATGRMRNYQLITSLIVCSVLPISWFLLKLGFDSTIVFITTIVITIINQVVCLFLVKRIFVYSISQYVSKVIYPCILVFVVSAFLPCCVRVFFNDTIIRLVIVCITSFISVCGCVYLFGMNNSERLFVIESISSRFNNKKK